MLIKVFGAAVQGIDATLITIEVNSSRGCMFYLVGLPDSAVKESHQRIISALQVNGYRMPTSNIVINMAPADIRKEGSAYDLPLAIGMLGASEVIRPDKLNRYLLMGELSLDGSLQPIKGALPIAIKARELSFEGIIMILRYLMSFDAFVEVSGAPSFTMPAKEKHRSSSVLVSQNAALSKSSGGKYYRSAMQGGMCDVMAYKNDMISCDKLRVGANNL